MSDEHTENTEYEAVCIDVHAETIEARRMSWKKAQEFVGGWLEPVYFDVGAQACMLCVDEEGLLKAKRKAFQVAGLHQPLVGNAVLFARADPELASVEAGAADKLRAMVRFLPGLDPTAN